MTTREREEEARMYWGTWSDKDVVTSGDRSALSLASLSRSSAYSLLALKLVVLPSKSHSLYFHLMLAVCVGLHPAMSSIPSHS